MEADGGRRLNKGGRKPSKFRLSVKDSEKEEESAGPSRPAPPTTPKQATRPKRPYLDDDNEEGVATPIFKSSTINNIISAMSRSSGAVRADSTATPPPPSTPPPPPTPPTPTTLEKMGGAEIGPWTLSDVLGEGSSGCVRLGAHRVTGEVVAVKVIRKERAHITQTTSLAKLELSEAERPVTVHRIPLGVEREVAILKLIRHPNVIQLVDIWENKANLYIVTEHVEKGDMYQFVNWNGPIKEDEAMSFFRQVMDGMQFIHSLNLCHRDLKLDNVLVGADGQIKIADFGMAAVHQFPLHRLGSACGSPHYTAPEVLKKETYDGSLADIWGMGVLLFCMLASRLPFDAETRELLAKKIMKADYDMPDWFSEEAMDFFSIVLVVDPTQRLSIAEMWGHPLIKKYDHLDYLNEPRESTGGRVENYPAILESAVDPQLFRQLQSIWHDYCEDEILWKLRQPTANDFKLFYWLLYRHRERQLAKYGTGATTSDEEKHLLKPPNWTNRYATCDFRRRARTGQTSATRFTVIDNCDGETADEDPFFPLGNPQLSPRKPFRMKSSNAGFAIHQYKVRRNGGTSIKADSASILSSRDGSARGRFRHVSNSRSRHRVRVDFSHIRSRSATRSTRSGSSDTTSLRSATSESEAEEESREGLSYIQPKPIAKDISAIIEEDVIKSGEEFSGDCDRAFFQNNSMLEAEAARAKHEPKPFSLSLNPEPEPKKLLDQSWYYGPPSDPTPYMNRPLPPLPPRMSEKSAEWVKKQPPPQPWASYGGAHLFPNPGNIKFTIAGASPGSRNTVHDPFAPGSSQPGPSGSGPVDDSSRHTASDVPTTAPEEPLAVPKRRKSAYSLFPSANIRNKVPPPGLDPPSAIPPVAKPPTRRSSWFKPSSKKVPEETNKIPRPNLSIPEGVLKNPPAADPGPIPSIRVVVESPPPRTPPRAPRTEPHPFDRKPSFTLDREHPSGLEPRPSNIPASLNIRHPSGLELRPSNIPAPLNIRRPSGRKPSFPLDREHPSGLEPRPSNIPAPLNIRHSSGRKPSFPLDREHPSGLEPRPSNIPAPLNIRKISQPGAGPSQSVAGPSQPVAGPSKPVAGPPGLVPIDIHRLVTLPNPLPVRERAPGLPPRRNVSTVATEARLKDEARAKELEAARQKRTSSAVGVPSWMKRSTKGEALAGDLAEIAKAGKARLAAAASGPASAETPPAVRRGRADAREALAAHGAMGFAADDWRRVAADNLRREAAKNRMEPEAPTFQFSWPKWLPQPNSADAGSANVGGVQMEMRGDDVENDDEFVTDDEASESGLPDTTTPLDPRAAAKAERIRKFAQFRRETGLAASSAAALESVRRVVPAAAAAPAAAPAPAPLDRKVEAKKPWLARLFGVKGKATVRYLCFAVTRGRTLRKVISQLSAWKGHGIEELVADRTRGMVWVTVGKKNSLKLKPVVFAIEVFRMVEETDDTVKELAIARFTLEKGSAKSLKEAVKTMEKVFGGKRILVADKQRAKMMTTTMIRSGR